MVCSGTVVKDPAKPGQSNLVATAGHCVHAGTEGGWFRNIAFVPAFNNNGAPDPYNAPFEEMAPYGIYWANYVSTTQYWIDNGTAMGGGGAHGDFAILEVENEDGSSQSLEETVGNAWRSTSTPRPSPASATSPSTASRPPIPTTATSCTTAPTPPPGCPWTARCPGCTGPAAP